MGNANRVMATAQKDSFLRLQGFMSKGASSTMSMMSHNSDILQDIETPDDGYGYGMHRNNISLGSQPPDVMYQMSHFGAHADDVDDIVASPMMMGFNLRQGETADEENFPRFGQRSEL